ncbi:MAG: 2-hydroxyacyl-CoA dehydratase [Dehalococcoidales bacterium]|nr:MAG: 2-hydroxyacyl-CoA dehydratase [Dehalococcoidales bacterium]
MTEGRKQRTHATEAAGKAGRLSRELTIKAQQAKEEGKPVAYSFIVCAYDEIIHAMDVVPVWTENYAGVCAAKRDAQRFLEKAEAENFSRSLCTYALCDLGFDIWRAELGEMPPDAPWRGLVRPDMMLGSGQLVCDPRNKWYQAAQHYMPDVPVYEVGMPWPQYESDYDYREVQGYYVKYIIEQLRGLVEFMEKHTGHKMDWEKLAEMVDITDKTWNLIWDTYELRRVKPCPMDTGDAMNTMVPIAFMMGTQEAYDFFLELNAELKQKVANGEGVIPDEKFRLLWGGGLPSWFALFDFNYFNSKGAVFPAETTYRSFENTRLFDIDLTKISDPLEHIAWRWIKYWTFWYDAARKRPGSHPDVERLIQYIEDYEIDGVVMHEAFSCRTWHPGLIWQLNRLKKVYRDIPSLVLESDIVDISSYSESDTHARIDAFIESLESVKRG